LARRLGEIRATLQNHSVRAALRLIDRAWRALPGAAQTLAPIYGRLLLLEDRDPDAALRVLLRVESADSEVTALIARAYFRLRRSDDARRCLEAALKSHAVTPEGLLAHEASAALQNIDLGLSGWIGLTPALELIGKLAPGHSADSLLIRIGDNLIDPAIQLADRDGCAQFRFAMPSGAPNGALHVSSGGLPLLGAGQRFPPDFGLDGRTDSDGRFLTGWVRIGWLPAQPVRLRIEDEHGAVVLARTRTIPAAGQRWPFRVNFSGRGLRGARIRVQARLPDDHWQPLPDTPFLLPRAIPPTRAARLPRWGAEISPQKRARPAAMPAAPAIDIIIPVYRGLSETLACIESVLSTAERARVIVVDDATPEPALAGALDDLAAARRIILIRNDINLGFVRSVNRALAGRSGRDVALLNSDTLVFGDWLERLGAAAYAGSRVGTVTPFSNDGSVASYPRRFGGAIDAEEAAALHEIAARAHSGLSAEIPVGVGFCLYIRHDCLEEVGELDASAFGAGYGEESDFCLRARTYGWSHRIAADVYVYHAGGGSFGPRRVALLDRSQRILNLRYPGYDRYITEFLKRDPLLPLRRKLDEQRLSTFEGRFVLLVTLALEGGVQRFVEERKLEIRSHGAYPLVLKPHRPGDARRCELSTDALDVPNASYAIPVDIAMLSKVLSTLRIDHIEIQHFLDIDPRVIGMVCSLGVPYEVMVHDYAWLCPRITMIDGSGRHCREPPVSVCESCVRRHGSRLPRSLSVTALRARSAAWLGGARRVSAPSSDTVARYRRYFPDLGIEIRPHRVPGGSTPQAATISWPARSGSPVRVGLIGAIGSHKGYRVLLDCARDAAERELPLEFVVVGYTENDRALLRTGKVEVTGRYVDAEVSHLLGREAPHVIFLPSVWPETWCYALDHALSAGLPIVAFDLGAIAERLRAQGGHTLLPLDTDARRINERMLEMSGLLNAEPYVQTSRPGRRDVTRIQETRRTTTMSPPANESRRDDGLSASLQVLPLMAGLYLFSVKSAMPAADQGTGALRLPAMHVGLGPGVHAEHVEFVAGPNTEGAWLFARGDVLVVKVNGTGATLILTSVRDATGNSLSIEVERLESRGDAPEAALPAADIPGAGLPRAAVPERDRVPAAIAARLAANGADEGTVPLQIKTHIRSRGDMHFNDAPWAGRVAPGLWLESFSIQPLRSLGAQQIEYKGLTGTGFETPWLSDDQNCGTKGMSVPLVGFAVRLKPGPETAAYDCEYSGYYQSGSIVGPLRNGAPCRSTVANDPLEGIQIRFVRRGKPAAAAAKSVPLSSRTEVLPTSMKGSSPGRQRRTESAAKKAKAEVGGSRKERLRATTRAQDRFS
jgi:GT2 family glycosyltransferase